MIFSFPAFSGGSKKYIKIRNYFFISNSVNFYEFIGFMTLNIEVHELVYVYSKESILQEWLLKLKLCTDFTLRPT